ncbi:hypothetical protein J6590_093897 [Homalodisca vitripennis]|nr:hypothetical protein J6590_093897 [Homalodisca vitripennis]
MHVWSCARRGSEPVRMLEATDDRCFKKIALGAIPQIRLSTFVVSVRFCEVGTIQGTRGRLSKEGCRVVVRSKCLVYQFTMNNEKTEFLPHVECLFDMKNEHLTSEPRQRYIAGSYITHVTHCSIEQITTFGIINNYHLNSTPELSMEKTCNNSDGSRMVLC